MRGLVPSKAFDRIFHQALSEPESSEVDTKRGRDKVKVIDQQAADYLIYEKYPRDLEYRREEKMPTSEVKENIKKVKNFINKWLTNPKYRKA